MKKCISWLIILILAGCIAMSMTACDDDDDDRFEIGRRELDEGRIDLDDYYDD